MRKTIKFYSFCISITRKCGSVWVLARNLESNQALCSRWDLLTYRSTTCLFVFGTFEVFAQQKRWKLKQNPKTTLLRLRQSRVYDVCLITPPRSIIITSPLASWKLVVQTKSRSTIYDSLLHHHQKKFINHHMIHSLNGRFIAPK